MIATHGYLAVFMAAFFEFLGVPVPSAVLLLYAGSVATASSLTVETLALSAAAGSVLADTVWFSVGRRHGQRLVRFYCTVSLGSRACARETEDLFKRFGVRALLAGKFIPGVCTFAAPLAGRSGMRLTVFLLWASLGSLFWASALVGGGALLGKAVLPALVADLQQMTARLVWPLATLFALMFGMKLWRRFKHGPARGEDLLREEVGSGPDR